MRTGIATLVVAALIEGFVILVTSLGTGEYGAPFPIGVSCGLQVFGATGCATTVSWPIVALDVAVTWAIMLVIAAWSGAPGLLAAGAAVVLFAAVVSLLSGAGAAFIGLPIPLKPAPPMLSTAASYWIDIMFWALVASAVVRLIRRKA